MQKLTIEYPLSTQSPRIVWELISNAHGLQKWLADNVTEEADTLTFTWGHPWTERDTKQSRVIEKEKYSYIRLLWDYHEDTPEAIWEMRIEKSDLTDELNLLITTMPRTTRKRPSCASCGTPTWNGCTASADCNLKNH